ncbi:MAG: hypothetical protein WAU15_11760 [Nitrosomonas sp.]
MNVKQFLIASTIILIAACGGKPTAPESPDPSSYGKTIQPSHLIPEEHQEGGGKTVSVEKK